MQKLQLVHVNNSISKTNAINFGVHRDLHLDHYYFNVRKRHRSV